MSNQALKPLEPDAPEFDERLDYFALRAYATAENVAHERLRLLQFPSQKPEVEKLGPVHKSCFAKMHEDEQAQLVRTVIDYHFEPYVVATMGLAQCADYYLAIKDRLKLGRVKVDPEAVGPLVIESMHHQACFSIHYLLIKALASTLGYKKAILLHQRKELDPRLAAIEQCCSKILGLDTALITFEGNWFATVRREVTPQTLVFYMGDMPPAMFSQHFKEGKTETEVVLSSRTGGETRVAGFSMASILTRYLKGHHYILDYPDDVTFQVRPAEGMVQLRCPVSSWVFWPALETVFPIK